MSATHKALAAADRAVLRWSEGPNAPAREEAVDILQTRPSETLIRGPLHVNEKTRVYLIKKGYTRIGIVKSCWEDHGLFLIQIALTTGSVGFASGYSPDPGVMVVEDFITEEQEAQILNDLENEEHEIPRQALAVTPEDRQAWQLVLDLQRLLRGIARSSPAPHFSWQQLLTTH